MEKTIAAFEARRQFGTILENVASRGDEVIVERYGTPVAAIVPIEVYEESKKSRNRFFSMIREAAERANLTPEEAEELALEAQRAVRGRR